jgi:hypothetical protein
MLVRTFAAASIVLLATACQAPQQARHSTSGGYSATYPASEQACVEYGFTPGTTGYNSCVSRERAARSSGRVNRDYAEANLSQDARNACYSYGLQPQTDRFDRCVGREIDARRYRPEAGAQPYPSYRTDQYGYRIDAEGYRVDANGYRISPQAYYAPSAYSTAPAYVEPRPATTGETAFRDEFGFRYDSRGNRLDRYGNIISPQTTTP